MGGNLKIFGVPQNHPFLFGIFHEINHPKLPWGSTISGSLYIMGKMVLE